MVPRKRLTGQADKIKKAAAGGGQRREISKDFKYNKSKLKHLKHILHNINVAQGTLAAALSEFSRVKGPDISPDGLLGGLGYILPIREIKDNLNTSVRGLSDVSDCLADELTNPKWDAANDTDVKKLIKEKEKVEEKVEEKIEESEFEKAPDVALKELDKEVGPEDVTTSADALSDESIQKLASAVEKSLLEFNSIGKRK